MPKVSAVIERGDFLNMKGEEKVIRRLKHSNYLFTVNTNKRVMDLDDPDFIALDEKLAAVMEEMFGGDNVMEYISVIKEGDTDDKIKDVVLRTAAEIGPKIKCLHYHVMIAIKHYTLVRVDQAGMKKDFREKMGRSLTCWFRRYNKSYDPDEFLLDYLRKNQKDSY